MWERNPGDVTPVPANLPFLMRVSDRSCDPVTHPAGNPAQLEGRIR